jgi:chromosome segregation ATPase
MNNLSSWKVGISDDQYRLAEMTERVEQLENAIRKHRDSWLSGDNACWKDNEELYKLLPEGFTPPERGTLVELKNCERYIASCHHPEVNYVSPQVRIEELEAKVKELQEKIERLEEVNSVWE